MLNLKNEFNFFLYRHIRLDKNEVFYIGIGRKRVYRNLLSHTSEYERAYTKSGRGSIWKRITSKTPFRAEIIFESSNEEEIKCKEIEFIKLYGRKDLKPGTLANLTDGGEGLRNPSLSTRKSISNKLRGIKRSDETKEKIRKVVLGTVKGERPKEVKDKISAKNKGSGNGMYGIKGKENKKSKPVYQYTLDSVFLKKWVNGREAATALNISYKCISACATGKQKSGHAFIWRY